MLRNAGTVMRHLTGGRVHLVLHGHRHHRGYAQVAFPQSGSKQDATHRMTIVAAGSIGTSGHQYSVIDVRPPGGIEVEEWKLEATLFQRQIQRTLVEVDAVRAERAPGQARARNATIAAATAESIEDHIEVSSSAMHAFAGSTEGYGLWVRPLWLRCPSVLARRSATCIRHNVPKQPF